MKILFLTVALFCFQPILGHAGEIQSACAGKTKEFNFNMPILIGATIFNDQVEICKVNGKRVGLLTVPKRFKAELKNIKLKGKKLSFSITANEGRGKFNVFYEGKLKEKGKFFVGLASLDKNKVLGPFFGVASEKKLKLKIVQ